jgi:hypothetical protein
MGGAAASACDKSVSFGGDLADVAAPQFEEPRPLNDREQDLNSIVDSADAAFNATCFQRARDPSHRPNIHESIRDPRSH